MTIELLCKVMFPPKEPVESRRVEEFSEIEQELGTTMPSDFKEYINLFGTGYIGRFLWVFNPFSNEESLNFIEQMEIRLDALEEIKEKYGDDECPYPLYPEPSGLLPWGATDNGDVLYWSTVGQPDEWTVVINESRGPKFEQYEESMTGFLAKLISGDIASKIIPYDFLDRDALFVPVQV